MHTNANEKTILNLKKKQGKKSSVACAVRVKKWHMEHLVQNPKNEQNPKGYFR